MIHVWIPGDPKTKGSLTHIGGGQLRDTPASSRWRALVAYMVRRHVERTAGPRTAVAVRGTFFLPSDDVTTPRCGDLDKLARNALDAGEDASAYVDDVQVVRLFVDKFADRERPGLLFTIWQPTPAELAGWAQQAAARRLVVLQAEGIV